MSSPDLPGAFEIEDTTVEEVTSRVTRAMGTPNQTASYIGPEGAIAVNWASLRAVAISPDDPGTGGGRYHADLDHFLY